MDTEKYLDEARFIAKKAGKMLKENIDTSAEVQFKGVVDLVTDFDNRAQKMIFEYLSDRFPNHDFLGEEDLKQERGREFRWIIDPLVNDQLCPWLPGFLCLYCLGKGRGCLYGDCLRSDERRDVLGC